jgi:uncharacterized protein YcgL (UPF0745 family)
VVISYKRDIVICNIFKSGRMDHIYIYIVVDQHENLHTLAILD